MLMNLIVENSISFIYVVNNDCHYLSIRQQSN